MRAVSGRRGTVSILVGAAMMSMVIISGLAVDLGRLYLVQNRLQTALDSAVLVAGREIALPNRDADTTAMFWANFAVGHLAGGASFFGGAATTPTITRISDTTVSISATATVPLVLGRLVGLPSFTISDNAQAVRANTGMELALVLDNTGSMRGAPMQAEIDGANQLISILYGATQDTVPNLWVAVVPFAASVNMGANHSGWLVSGSLDQTKYANTSWKGCVLARHANNHDADDAPPSVAAFQPFIYASTLGKYQQHGKVLAGDDDWSANTITEDNQATLPANTAVGPNLGCTAASILPETASRAAVLNRINSMQATSRGGTFINLGLQAGWFTISPRWLGLWGNASLPLAYNTPNMAKAIVLMTDGNNEWYSWPGGAPDNQGDGDATAYGRLSTNMLGLGSANATVALNASMASMCTTIKAAGITLYTILYNHDAISTATQQLFQTCASAPQDYFLAPTAADLQTAFSAIGTQLASLRLSQ